MFKNQRINRSRTLAKDVGFQKANLDSEGS